VPVSGDRPAALDIRDALGCPGDRDFGAPSAPPSIRFGRLLSTTRTIALSLR